MKRQDRVDGLKAVRGSPGSPKKEKSGPQTFCLLTTRPNGRPLFALRDAIDNWKKLERILRQMQLLSRKMIFETLPNPARRKRLGKKILGII